jgi:hypothetical protein
MIIFLLSISPEETQKISYAWSFTNNTLKFVRNRKNKQRFQQCTTVFLLLFFKKKKIQNRKWIDTEIIWITLNIGSFNEWKSEVLLCLVILITVMLKIIVLYHFLKIKKFNFIKIIMQQQGQRKAWCIPSSKNLTRWPWPLTLKINRVPDSLKD